MRDLNALHPVVKEKALKLQALAKSKLNLNIIFTMTLRTAAEQAAFYAQGRLALSEVNRLRKVAALPPITDKENRGKITKAPTIADSFHGYGLAFDIAITDPSGKTINWNTSDWNGNKVDDWKEVGTLAAECGLSWGGAFKSIVDMPHFEDTMGWTISSLKAAKVPAGVTITQGFK